MHSQPGIFRTASVFPGYLTGKIGKLRVYEDHQVEFTMGSSVRVAIIEDDEDVRDMLERVFRSTDGLILTGSWPSMEAALKPVKMHRPDVVLLDIGLPGMSGLDGAAELLKLLPQVKILMLTGRDAREDIFAALRAGASGYVTKGTSQAEIVKAVLSVSEGNAALSPEVARTVVEVFRPNPQQYELTRRELEILGQLCNGASYKEIAASLFVEQSTVHFHLKNIYRKLDVRSKGEAIAKALQEKLVSAL
jgi:DNA-binding NarL/FixJ family response regulator